MTFTQAMLNARSISIWGTDKSPDGTWVKHQRPCTQHVTAKVRLVNGLPIIDPEGYGISDWFDGSVIATFYNGDQKHN